MNDQDTKPMSWADSGRDQRADGRYRADIDGLRAVAVLSILLFHLGIGKIPGGFVGVDIFFVISGYLIGGVILSEIRRGEYSVSRFYLRRFRRIIPALVVMLVATTILMWVVAFPAAMMEYGESLISSMLSVSNFFFLSKSGYFDPSSETQPLLHTWSLAVEEQYYIVFPILMLALKNLSSIRNRTILISISVISLLLSIYGVRTEPTATFYLLPTRFWELLLGVLAVELRADSLDRRMPREGLAFAGLILLAGSIFFYSSTTPFPGLAALPPCLGTAMILVAGAHGKTVTGRVLSQPPLVFFGLISYSLYLWHWPLIVLAKAWLPAASLNFPARAATFVLSVALGWLSWRIVERPWRSPKIGGRKIMWSSAIASLVVCCLGGGLVLAKGAPGRFAPSVVRLEAFANDSTTNDFRSGRCFISSAYQFSEFDQKTCLYEDKTKQNVLLMGDSHAAHLWFGLSRRFPQINLLQATASGCKPVLARRPDDAPRCAQMMTFLFDDYLPRRDVDRVILSASWDPVDAADVAATLDWMRAKGIHVILSGPIVRYDVPLPEALALALQRHDARLVDRVRKADSAALDRQYQAIATAHGANYFSPYQALCRRGTCQTTTADGAPLQFDYGHLTAAGSLLVAQNFPISQFASLSGQKPDTRLAKVAEAH